MTITLGRALNIIERAKNCLVCFPLSEPTEVYENTMAILGEYKPEECIDIYPKTWKYVVKLEMGLEVPIVFPELIKHCDMCRKDQVVSAGFCVLDGERTSCYGESTSLGVKSRPGDTALLRRFLFTR